MNNFIIPRGRIKNKKEDKKERSKLASIKQVIFSKFTKISCWNPSWEFETNTRNVPVIHVFGGRDGARALSSHVDFFQKASRASKASRGKDARILG